MSKTVKIVVLGDAKDAARAFKTIRDEADKTESRLTKVGQGMTKVGTGMTLGVTLPLVALGKASIDAAIEAEEATARMESSFDSMGSSAWTSMEKLKEQANTLGNELTTVGDEAVMETQARMLTFGNVTGEVFDRSIMAAIDFGEKMGTDAASAAMQLGKAINDPVRGMTTLTKQGITFTDAQKDMVKQMVASGDTMAAQDVILDELERQFGGTAAAMADTASGEMKQAMNQLGEAGESVGAVLLPVLADLAEKVADLAGWFSDLNPETQKMIVMFGGVAAAAGPLLVITGKLITAVNTLKDSKLSLGKALGSPLTGPLVIATGLAVGFAAVIKQNSDRTNDWAAALEGGSSAVGTFADDLLVAEIANRGLDESMAEANVTAADMKEAILGDSEAFQAFVDKLGPGQQDLMTWVEAQRIAREKADAHKAAIDAQRSALETSSSAMPIFAGAMQGYTEATQGATGATGDLDEATYSLIGTTDAYRDAQRRNTDSTYNLIASEREATEARDAYNVAVKEFGPSSAEAITAAEDLWGKDQALIDAARTFKTDAGPNWEAGFRAQQESAGVSAETVQAVIDKVNGLEGAITDVNGSVIDIKARVTAPRFVYDQDGNTMMPRTTGVVALARGGIATDPTRALIGEAGDEAVIPLEGRGISMLAEAMRQALGITGSAPASNGLVVQFTGPVYGFNDVERAIVDIIVRARRRGVAV